MKILYAMPGWKPAYRIGGPIASVAAAAERLVKKGHQLTVVATNSNLDRDLDVPLNTPVDVDGVTVWYFRREEPLKKYLPFIPYISQSIGYLYSPELGKTIDRLVAEHDVVDTQMPFIYPTYAAGRAALRRRVPLFYHQRGNYLESHLSRRSAKKRVYISLFERPLMRAATTLIALTAAEREAFARVSPQTPSVIVPNGVEIPEPQDREAVAARIEQRYGIARDATVIAFLGRLHPWKGIDELLDAFMRVQARFPDACIVLAGADECNAQQRWSAVAEQQGIGKRVVFPGVITGAEKEDLLWRADLFALPSTGEGLSMAILEALAHSTAVMLSPGCNFPDAEAHRAGVTVAKEPAAMAGVLASLLSSPQRLRAMGDAGRALVAERYSWDVVTDKLIDVYSRA